MSVDTNINNGNMYLVESVTIQKLLKDKKNSLNKNEVRTDVSTISNTIKIIESSEN